MGDASRKAKEDRHGTVQTHHVVVCERLTASATAPAVGLQDLSGSRRAFFSRSTSSSFVGPPWLTISWNWER